MRFERCVIDVQKDVRFHKNRCRMRSVMEHKEKETHRSARR